MKRLLEKIGPWLFAVWTIGVMATYFYFYQNYGFAFLTAFFFCCLFLIAISFGTFFMFLPFAFLKKPFPFVEIFRNLPPVFQVPVTKLIIVFYGCVTTWILLICFLKPDIGIAKNSIISVTLVSLIALTGFSIGSVLIRRFRLEYESFLERFILATLLGFGILMLIIYCLGMMGFLYPTLGYILVFGSLFLFRKEWRLLFQEIKRTHLEWKIRPFFTFENFAIIASFILFVFATTGLLSQFAAGWDEMHTYQAFPKAYAKAHAIVDFKYWFASGFPQNTEMLFTLGFLLKGFTVASGLNTVFYFLLPGILILIKRLVFPKASSAIVVLLYALSAIPFLMITIDHKIDLAFWCYTLLATLYLLKFFRTPNRKIFLLSCVIMGITAGAKYNFFSIVLPSFLIVLFFFPREFNLKKRVANIVICLAIIAICFSPWAIKNIIFTGNPVEPALGDLFSRDDTFFKQIERSYSEHLKEFYFESNVWVENQDKKNLKFYISLPFRLTFNYKKNNFDDLVNIGPIYLIFLAIGIFFLAQKNDRFLKKKILTALTCILILQFFFWFLFGNFLPWYAISSFLLVLPFISWIIKIKKNRFIQISIYTIIFALSLATFFIRLDRTFRNSTFFVREYNGTFNLYEVAQFINKNNPKGHIWDSYGYSLNYYVNHPEDRVIYDYHLEIFQFLRKKYSDADLIKKLKSMNVSYFVFKESNIEYFLHLTKSARDVSPKSSKLFEECFVSYIAFRNNYLTEIFRSGDIAIYTYSQK